MCFFFIVMLSLIINAICNYFYIKLTAHCVKRVSREIMPDGESATADPWSELVQHHRALFRKYIYKVVETLHAESRSQDFSPRTPYWNLTYNKDYQNKTDENRDRDNEVQTSRVDYL